MTISLSVVAWLPVGVVADTLALAEDAPEVYIVKKGDTLYRISRRYNLSIEQLRQYNQLDQKASSSCVTVERTWRWGSSRMPGPS